MAKRGRKAGKALGPLRRILGTEPNHLWLPFSRRWVREGEAHVLECGHRLLVDPDRARARGYRPSRCCPKCRDGRPAPRVLLTEPLTHVVPCSRFR